MKLPPATLLLWLVVLAVLGATLGCRSGPQEAATPEEAVRQRIAAQKPVEGDFNYRRTIFLPDQTTALVLSEVPGEGGIRKLYVHSATRENGGWQARDGCMNVIRVPAEPREPLVSSGMDLCAGIIIFGRVLAPEVARVEATFCLRPAGGDTSIVITPTPEGAPPAETSLCRGVRRTVSDTPVNEVFALLAPSEGAMGIGLCEERALDASGQPLYQLVLASC